MKRLLAALALILLLPIGLVAQPVYNLFVGQTTIGGGTNGYVLYNNNGRLGNIAASFPASTIAIGTPVTGGTNYGLLWDNANTLASSVPLTNYTSNQTLATSQAYGAFSNLGASGSVTLTLPTPAAGLEYTFVCAEAQTFTLDVSGSVVIAIGEIAGTPGAGASCNSPYSSITLKAVSTTLWVATASSGSWTNP